MAWQASRYVLPCAPKPSACLVCSSAAVLSETPCSSLRQVSATVRAGGVPALPGAAEVLAAGVTSSLHPANEAAAASCVRGIKVARALPQWRLLLDPQTGDSLTPSTD